MKNKHGFGLIEVLAAAVVLGFLIVGLTQLQKGNREAVLRVRARDGAQVAATEVIDSLRRIGLSSIEVGVPIRLTKKRTFEGAVGQSEIEYTISVHVSNDAAHKSEEQTELTRAATSDELAYDYAKRLDVFVEWPFKQSTQGIQVSEVIK